MDPHIVKICGGKCVVGSHQAFLININYHKIPLKIFLGGPTYCQNMRFKICGRSRSDLKMSNNKHLLLQQPFLININYHKILLRIFLGDIGIPPMTQALAPPKPKAPPHPIAPSPLSHLSAPPPAPPPFPWPFGNPGATNTSEFEYLDNKGKRSLGINSNQVLGIPSIYKRSAAYM